MPILELIAVGTHVYNGAKGAYQTGQKIGERLEIKSANRDVANWVSQYDYGRRYLALDSLFRILNSHSMV